ncbi:hypothetical protein [Paenibacillus macerans]|uniref:hypothetical protein n=1 Tax=Paenibacillus macerans TaxID=44252 RepID=UPI003D31B0C1
MMKLLKYDLKRNANTFLGLAAVLVIVQGLISVFGNLRHWEEGAILALSVILYASSAIIMIVLVCKTFGQNIKAYHRRLLPVTPVWSIVSSLLFSWIVALAIAVIIAAHAFLYLRFAGIPVNFDWGPVGIKDWILVALGALWLYTLLIITIFMAMTIGASVSVNGKAGTWVGIIAFFVIQNGMSWLESLIFGNNDPAIMKFAVFHVGLEEVDAGTPVGASILSLGPFLFELVLAALMFYAITYLLRKKVEI